MMVLCCGARASGQTFSRDVQVDVILNQVGFTPGASKQCLLEDCEANVFAVIRTEDPTKVFSAPLTKTEGDFGTFLVGDFSQLRETGTYYVKAGESRSFPFRIAPNVYEGAIDKIVGYFALQRCGPSSTGYLTPCHCDDAVRLDNGKHQDTTGGWHDASDLRKWVGATIHGMIGLSHVYELTDSETLRARIIAELRWGNRYFLSMQEPEGYVMSHVGGDALQHGDGNRWTDNLIGPAGGDPRTIAPAPGRSTKMITIVGNKDDRVIKTNPLDRLGQYKFVIAQARVARITRADDPSYSAECLAAAQRCYAWCQKDGLEKSTGDLGGSLVAALELYRATAQDRFHRDALACASRLTELQVTEAGESEDAVRGFFQRSSRDTKPHRDIWQGCWHLFGLCDLVALFPDHVKADQWRRAIRLYTQDYLAEISRRNNFGLVPYGLFANEDPGGDRQTGPYWYRYFMRPVDGWWVGINANAASAGVGLLMAADVLEEPALRVTAQRQLDWILGCNPFRASTVQDVGYNHPPPFINDVEFLPTTPRLPGAVMNGLGGTMDDQPLMSDGIYNVSEYWTPMVSYTVWLMALLEQHDE
jgi:hypothetical protein